MIQFTQLEIDNFRKKINTNKSIIENLKNTSALIYENDLQIQTTGLANWGHYYYCNDCSIKLTYNFFENKKHICPNCGKQYKGEPYDGAWWRLTNGKNCDAAHELGLLYILTQNVSYAKKAGDILLEYAKYYPNYEVHGDIPYNGPGKANAQTLCEATFLRTLAYSYDLIKDTLTDEEQNLIETDLLKCGAEFLVQNRHDQIHNHEVITNSAIAVIGLILNNDEYINFAVYEKYGLLYQLENGVLEDGIWFECSLGYHFYALQSFFAYEKFAQHTKHSNIMHPLYQKMFDVSLKYVLPDGSLPQINDTAPHHRPIDSHDLLEFAYKSYKSDMLLKALNIKYELQSRGDLQSFFYGVDTLPIIADLTLPEYHSAVGSGVTIIRDDPKQYLLFRHSPYGGEHDHYDRLGISYYYDKKPISIDFGTTGYGAYYHYKYFKNTGTHNTVVINEENHAPSKAEVLNFERDEKHCFIDARVHWDNNYEMPDSFVICQWDEESYKGVTMHRQLYKTPNYIIDVFTVENVKENKSIDWVMHFNGERIEQNQKGNILPEFSKKEPFCYLHTVQELLCENKLLKTSYLYENLQTDVYTALFDSTMFYATGPNNPTCEDINFLIERKYGENAVFINVIATALQGKTIVENVNVCKKEKCVIIEIIEKNTINEHVFNI